MSDLVGNPEDRFSRVAAHIFVVPITKTSPCDIQIFYQVFFFLKIFSRKNLIFFLIFAQNIDCGYNLCTHNLRFGAKIMKIGIPLLTPVLLYRSGV